MILFILCLTLVLTSVTSGPVPTTYPVMATDSNKILISLNFSSVNAVTKKPIMKDCRKKLAIFALAVCAEYCYHPDLYQGCERKVTEEWVRDLCCPNQH